VHKCGFFLRWLAVVEDGVLWFSVCKMYHDPVSKQISCKLFIGVLSFYLNSELDCLMDTTNWWIFGI